VRDLFSGVERDRRRPGLALRGVHMKREERRGRLRNRRASVSFPLEVQGLRFTAMFSRFDDNRIAEIFLNNHKAGSSAGILGNDAAVACSLALQFGCPIETLARALSRDGNGNATGPLGVALDAIIKDDENASH
jgi:hypothetical protein